MKTITTILLAIPLLASAQTIKVEERSEDIADGRNNTFSVTVFEADEKTVEKEWKDVLKDFNGKTSSKKNELFTDDATIKAMSENTVDIYTRFTKVEGGIKVTVGFDLGGAFVSSSNDAGKAKVATEILHDFGVKVTKKAMEDIVKEEEKNQEKMEKDLADMVSEKETLKKNIERWTEQIEKAKEDIKKNEKSQEEKSKERETQ
jgi:hypothetical protein